MGSCLGSCITKETQTATNATAASCLRRQATDEQDSELISNTSEQQDYRQRSFIYRIFKFKRKKKCAEFIDKYLSRQDANYAKLSNGNGNGADSNSDIQLQNLDAYKLLHYATLAKETESNNYARAFSSRASSSLDLEWEHEYTQLRQQYRQQQQQQQKQQQHLQRQEQSCHANVEQYPYQQQDDQMYALPCTPTSSLGAYAASTEPMLAQIPANAMPTIGARTTRLLTRSSTRQGSRTSACSSQNSWSHISTPESLEWDIDGEQEQQRQLRLEDDNLDVETLKLLHQIEQLKNHVLQETGDGLYEHADQTPEQFGLQFDVTHFSNVSAGNGTLGLEAHIS